MPRSACTNPARRVSVLSRVVDTSNFGQRLLEKRMNGMRKIFVLVIAALMLAAFALPGFAADQSQNKTFKIAASVQTQGLGLGSSVVKIVLTNTSPKQSGSTYSSADAVVNFLSWNASDCTVAQSGSAKPLVCLFNDPLKPGHFIVNNLDPVKPGGTVTFTITLDTSSCGDATWDATPWSSSQINNGNFFSRLPFPNDPSTPISPVACADLACNFDPDTGAPDPESFTVGDILGFRWSYNKDGGAGSCGATNVYVPISLTRRTQSTSGGTVQTPRSRWRSLLRDYVCVAADDAQGWLAEPGWFSRRRGRLRCEPGCLRRRPGLHWASRRFCGHRNDLAAAVRKREEQHQRTSTTLKVDTTTPAGAIATPALRSTLWSDRRARSNA